VTGTQRLRLVTRTATALRGEVWPPPDKSISHRALMISALAEGESRISNLSSCVDVGRTRECLERLGVQIADEGGDVLITGRGMRGLGGPTVVLPCGDSGTTMRLLMGVLAGQEREFVLVAGGSLARRPMNRVASPLRQMGASIRTTSGHAPVYGQGQPLTGGRFELAAASAQVGSAILLAGLVAEGETSVLYPAPVRDHTERMLEYFGVSVGRDDKRSCVRGPAPALRAQDLVVPGDISGAAFLIVAAVMIPGSDVLIRGCGVNHGRMGFVEHLKAMGAQIEITPTPSGQTGGEPVADIRVRGTTLRGTDMGGEMVARSIDELPILAVVATQATGRTVISGAAELRVKECDRIAAMTDGLTRLGAKVEATDDGFLIEGPTPLTGRSIRGYGDHRVVMALAIAGLVADGETSVSHGERTDDSFPGFREALAALGATVALEPVRF